MRAIRRRIARAPDSALTDASRTPAISSVPTCRRSNSARPKRSTMTERSRAGPRRPALARARARLAAGDIAGARREALDSSQRGDPARAAAAHLVLSACAERAGDARQARAQVTSGAARNADDALAHYARAELEEHAGDRRRAPSRGSRARSRCSRRSSLRNNDSASCTARPATRSGPRHDSAASRRLDPANARGIQQSGQRVAHARAGRDEALAAFERAVALRPDYELAIANVAVMRRDAGEIERAEALLRRELARPRSKPPLRAIVVHARRPVARARCARRGAAALPAGDRDGAGRERRRMVQSSDGCLRRARRAAPARDAYGDRSISIRGPARGARIELSLPMVYDAADIWHARADYATGLARARGADEGPSRRA